MRYAIALAVLSTVPGYAATAPLYEPALSPDHSEIAFVSGGDIWTVPFAGGVARLLVSHPATESRPLYSPDGKRMAFISARTGASDIYVLTLTTGEVKRITFDDVPSVLSAWSPDSKYLYFSSNREDIGGMADLYRVSADGGTPASISADRYSDESQAAPNPVNGSVAFTSGSMANSQWWRKGHAHIDETKFILLTPGPVPRYQPLLENHAKNLWPMWAPDGMKLFYMSDASGSENIWEKPLNANPRQITKFTDGRVLFPSISRDGKAIVFERDFHIWKLDPASGSAAEVPIEVKGAAAGASSTHLSLNNGFRDLALSPDGKKIAFAAHGEIFAASAKDGGNAVRISTTPANEGQLSWAPDSKRLAYISDREGPAHIYLYDFGAETETALTSGPGSDARPSWSPDGTRIAWFREGRELHVMQLETKTEKTLLTKKLRTLGTTQDPISWSPDGKWISFIATEARGFANVSVIAAEGGDERPLSFLANRYGEGPVWSPDRTYILFSTGQRTERRSIARIDLIPRTPSFREDQFRNLFRTEPTAKPASKEVRIDFEGIRRRLRLLNLGLDVPSATVSPDGKTLLFIASAGLPAGPGSQQNLYTFSLDEFAKEPPVPRQLTSTAGAKANAQFSPDGKEVYYLDAGRISSVAVDTRTVRPLAVTAELDVNFDQEKKEVFHQAWTIVNETYYDPQFHGANWPGIRGRYAKWIEAARTADEMRRVISLMIGELNSSHSGINAPQQPGGATRRVTGRLGLTIDPADNTILTVTPLGPAAVAGIKPGEKLLAVDGVNLTPDKNLDELLQYRIDRRTLVTTSARKDIPVLPVSSATEKELLYREWVEGRRAYVDRISGGRLGYVHILNMSAEALDQLYLDLDAENQNREGVVVDIRNNTGGFVNSYALDVFTRRGYLTMTPRDRVAASARSMNGQRSLELPTVLVVNQNSLSDAEDFTEGYRALKLGKVVGVPTAGWIIYTGSATLIDGSSLRTPTTKVTANDGTDMELHPRPVDVTAERPVGESYTGRDSQLDTAVKELLAALGAKTGQ